MTPGLEDADPVAPTASRGRTAFRMAPELGVFVVAVVARLIPVIRFGSFNGNFGYDAGVYYAGSSALLHGRMPYRDFVMLHPPGILLADAPFAELGRLTTDHTGFVAAALAAMTVGGFNSVLVMRIARRLGLDRSAAIAGGLVYALWFGSVSSEYLPRLEPVGNLLMLVGGLALLAGHQGPPDRLHRWVLPLVGGASFAAAVSVKLWWALPILVLLGWLAVAGRNLRSVLVAGLGAFLAAALIDLPFLLAARSTMYTMIISDQLGRVANNTHNLRVASYLAIGTAGPIAARGVAVTAVLVVAAVLVVVAVRAWRQRAARVAVILLGVQLVQIAVEPSWFTFYADFLTIALALTVAAAFSAAPGGVLDALPSGRRRVRRAVAPVVVGVVTVGLLVKGLSPELIAPFPRRALTEALAGKRCVMTDAPIGLIQTNTLTRDLNNHCQLWVDVTGKLYGTDRPTGNPRKTRSYTRWQPDITRYLLSGDAVLFVRDPAAIRISRASLAVIERGGLITAVGGYAVYRTPRDRPTAARN